MDVSSILAEQQQKRSIVTVQKDIDLQLDLGYLAVTDANPIDGESFNHDLEGYLQSTARDGVQALFTAVLQLPRRQTPDGPLTLLPPPTTLLPRTKPLPKPKPPTRWERFAAAKGIQKKRRERMVWDEERQDWVPRWGRGGKNKETEEAWLTEVKANADVDHDPAKEARASRKARTAKNERQRQQNLRTSGLDVAEQPQEQKKPGQREQRKQEIERTLATTRKSTASMGRFDRTLEGEQKLRGVKRKFEPTEQSALAEKKQALALISKLHNTGGKSRKDGDVLNMRKAVAIATEGKGATALAKKSPSKGAKGKRANKRR